MTIYKIFNNVNNFVYVGLTTRDPSIRWREHHKSAEKGINRRLYRAMRKYGLENFTYEILATLEDLDNESMLFALEKAYISRYNSYWFGYNDTIGGKGYKYNRPKRGRKKKA